MNGRRVHGPGRLLERLIPEPHREALLGDLAEERALRSRSGGAPSAARWHRRQLLGSVVPLLGVAVKRSRWAATLGVALGAYLALGIVELAATLALDRLVTAGTDVTLLLSLIVGVAIAALIGYQAARIRPGAALTLAVIMVVVVAALMATSGESAPLWYQLGYLVAGPAAVLAAEAWRAKSSARR